MYCTIVLDVSVDSAGNLLYSFSKCDSPVSRSVGRLLGSCFFQCPLPVLVRCMFVPARVSGLVGYKFVIEVARKYFVEEGLVRRYEMQRFSIFLL